MDSKGGIIINMRLKCTSIDVIQTGKKLESIIRGNNCRISDLQRILNLSCPQPIYRWMYGQILPSVDNLYMLSRIFEMHMEDMLVARGTETNESQQSVDTDIK